MVFKVSGPVNGIMIMINEHLDNTEYDVNILNMPHPHQTKVGHFFFFTYKTMKPVPPRGLGNICSDHPVHL